jgi:ABC-type Fe3+/spermidine/putrescine transport system ATPase subunit
MISAATSTPARPRDIDLRGICKSYGEQPVLQDVSFTLRDGEFLTLLGPSGSGKTTTLSVLAGFVAPDTGSISTGEKSLLELPPRERNLGVVFQNYALFPHMSVIANVEFGLRMRKVAGSERQRRALAALKRVGLEGFEKRMPAQLSGGQQQRVALARALVIDPAALLLDEPLGALDRRLRQQVGLELKGLQRETGVAVLNVTHDQEEAMVMSDRLAVMRNGRIEQIGTPAIVYKHPRNRFVANFLGEANFLDVKVDGKWGEHARIVFPDGSLGMAHVSQEYTTQQPGSAGTICLRPERLRWAREQPAHPAQNAVDATFVSGLYLGASSRCVFRAFEQDLVLSCPDAAGCTMPEPGERVSLQWNVADAQLFAAS